MRAATAIPGRRLLGLLVVMALVMVAVSARLTVVQVFSTARYTAYGKAEVLHTVSLPALRGTIYDSTGMVLAVSEPVDSVIADDNQVTDPAGEASQLAPLLGMGASRLEAQLSLDAGYVVLAEDVSASTSAQIEALDLPGLTFEAGAERVMPAGSLALPVIGQVNSNGVGYSGVEEQYDGLLTGHAGSEVLPLDPNGRAIPGGPFDVAPARPGQGLVLTINSAIQFDAEAALASEITKSQAQSGWLAVLGTNGDILALADLVAAPGGGTAEASQALALTSVYEPGSVAKLATFAGALSQGLITPQEVIDVPPSLPIGGYQVTDAESHGYEQLTASQVLARSSNIGTDEIAAELGPQGLYHWLAAMGWTSATGLGFPGDSPGLLPPVADWSGSTMASMPIGQAEALSALQVADAYNMAANGGVFVPPRLVSDLVSADGTWQAVPSPATHRVLSPAVASELMGMLGGVVGPSGTAPAAAVPGYTVAGKTGTAQIPSGGGYLANSFMASFVGIVPAEHPALTIVVTLDQPAPPDYYGGTVAAPVFAQVAAEALRLLHVPPGSPTAGALVDTGADNMVPSSSVPPA